MSCRAPRRTAQPAAALVLWCLVAAGDACCGQSPVPDPQGKTPSGTTGRLTGDWGGLRSQLENQGLSFDLFSNSYYGCNASGGVNTNGAGRASSSYDLLVRAELDRLSLTPGGEVFMFVQGFWGQNINPQVGALGAPIDDADGDKDIYIDQLWYQRDFFERKLLLRAGYLDQQAILDRNAYANSEDKQFMNTFLDNDSAIIPLTIGLGASAFYQPAEWLGFVAGVADVDGRQFDDGFNTAFHGGADFFGYLQTDAKLRLPSRRGPLPGTARFGTFYDPRSKVVYERSSMLERTPPDTKSGDEGFYASCDQMVYREGPEDAQGLGVFARYGLRHGDVNRISQFWSVGAEYAGLLPERKSDVLAFGMYAVHGSNQYQDSVDSEFSRETGFELYYKMQITPWLAVTPAVQYIVNPGGVNARRDSFVAGLRARMSL